MFPDVMQQYTAPPMKCSSQKFESIHDQPSISGYQLTGNTGQRETYETLITKRI